MFSLLHDVLPNTWKLLQNFVHSLAIFFSWLCYFTRDCFKENKIGLLVWLCSVYRKPGRTFRVSVHGGHVRTRWSLHRHLLIMSHTRVPLGAWQPAQTVQCFFDVPSGMWGDETELFFSLSKHWNVHCHWCVFYRYRNSTRLNMLKA